MALISEALTEALAKAERFLTVHVGKRTIEGLGDKEWDLFNVQANNSQSSYTSRANIQPTCMYKYRF